MAAAEGILRIATTTMSHVVRRVTTERGLDAAEFALVAYGGAGPLHAAMVARELRIAQVIVPRAPGHFSAWGMLVADLRRDFVHTWFTPLAAASLTAMAAIYEAMEREGHGAMAGHEAALAAVTVSRAADMRYVGQEHAVTVELPLDALPRRRTAPASSAASMRFTRSATAMRAESEPAEIVSLQERRHGHDGKAAFGAHRARRRRAARRRVPRHAPGLFRRDGRLRWRRRLMPATRFAAATALPGRRWSRNMPRPRWCIPATRSRWTNSAISWSTIARRSEERNGDAHGRCHRCNRRHGGTASRRSGRHRDRAQLPHRRDRGDEDQSDAHRLQHDHLRSARLYRRAVRCATATRCRSASACRCSSAA